jgi:hypothetical protein
MSKTTNEKIVGIETKIAQLENERKRLMGLQKAADRKARTKRLIERGAILESLIPDPATFTNDQIKLFLEKVITAETTQNFLAGPAMRKAGNAAVGSQWKAPVSSNPPDAKSAQMTMGTD